eukprot:TRINITY_DN8209_c0_g1_i1.p1 TRINITY_DN8209_c0_g1~~TRINITY_DN8209_c0_g1_i1.p1  ORF type:complete len:314 (-),score=141.56 TRINITY_DN8209_c0_g1_i1:14-826(-)
MSLQFESGEVIYAYHQGLIYEAKILEMDVKGGRQMYYIHYKGWKDKWNEWVDDTRILKHTEENTAKRDRLKQKKRGRPPITTAKATTTTTHEDTPAAKIDLTSVLRKILLEDRDLINHHKSLVRLPRTHSVHYILDRFKEDSGLSQMSDSSNMGFRRAILADLEILFEVSLGSRLLYRFERPQFEDIHQKINSGEPVGRLSQIYGPEHFVRFLSKLPELLSAFPVDLETHLALCAEVSELIKFLSKSAPQITGSHNYEEVSVQYLRRLDL